MMNDMSFEELVKHKLKFNKYDKFKRGKLSLTEIETAMSSKYDNDQIN